MNSPNMRLFPGSDHSGIGARSATSNKLRPFRSKNVASASY